MCVRLLDRDAGGETRGTAFDAELLNEVFRFKYKTPSSVQEERVGERLVQHFIAFVDTLKPANVEGFACSAKDALVSDRDVPIRQHTKEKYCKLQRVYEILNSVDSLSESVSVATCGSSPGSQSTDVHCKWR